MPWTSGDLANVDAAIAAGARIVKYSDREVEFQSIKDLIAARAEIVNYLASISSPQKRQTLIYTDKGW